MHKSKLSNHKGFSTVEALLLVLVIVVVGGAGYMVLKRSKTNNDAVSTPVESSVAANKTTVDANKVGTTTGVDQLTAIEQTSENSLDTKYEGSEKTDSTSTSKSANDIGGAYNEANF
jgi:hypothetical protein